MHISKFLGQCNDEKGILLRAGIQKSSLECRRKRMTPIGTSNCLPHLKKSSPECMDDEDWMTYYFYFIWEGLNDSGARIVLCAF
jgi:hypothetical protein